MGVLLTWDYDSLGCIDFYVILHVEPLFQFLWRNNFRGRLLVTRRVSYICCYGAELDEFYISRDFYYLFYSSASWHLDCLKNVMCPWYWNTKQTSCSVSEGFNKHDGEFLLDSKDDTDVHICNNLCNGFCPLLLLKIDKIAILQYFGDGTGPILRLTSI